MNRKEILEAADKCVNGHREADYGSPEDNFSIISKLWSTYKGVEFTPVDVALMLALLKVARARSGKGTDDCFVDLAGYAACAGELFGKEMPSNKKSDDSIYEALMRAVNKETTASMRTITEGLGTNTSVVIKPHSDYLKDKDINK